MKIWIYIIFWISQIIQLSNMASISKKVFRIHLRSILSKFINYYVRMCEHNNTFRLLLHTIAFATTSTDEYLTYTWNLIDWKSPISIHRIQIYEFMIIFIFNKLIIYTCLIDNSYECDYASGYKNYWPRCAVYWPWPIIDNSISIVYVSRCAHQ